MQIMEHTTKASKLKTPTARCYFFSQITMTACLFIGRCEVTIMKGFLRRCLKASVIPPPPALPSHAGLGRLWNPTNRCPVTVGTLPQGLTVSISQFIPCGGQYSCHRAVRQAEQARLCHAEHSQWDLSQGQVPSSSAKVKQDISFARSA